VQGDYDIDEQWWSIQRDRCLNGYTVKNAIAKGGDMMIDDEDVIWYGDEVYIPQYDLRIKNKEVHISGRHYFYLNFWPIYGLIQGTQQKGIIKPRFLMMDFFFYRRIEMMMEQQKDGQEAKGRQEGFSEKCAGGIIGFNYSFIPSSVNVVVAGIQEDADNTFSNVVRGLDSLANTQFYKEPGRRDITGGFMNAKNFGSKVYALTAKDKPQAVSRISPTWVIYEEIGKGKKDWSLETARFVNPSQYAEGVKTGYSLYIGTGGSMDDGAADLEERHYNPHKYNILEFKNNFEDEKMRISDTTVGHFTGKHWFHIVDKDGNPMVEQSKKGIEKEIANAPVKERHIQRSQWAIYASDAFMRSAIGYFGEEISAMLQKRKREIMMYRENKIVRVGRLIPEDLSNPYKGVRFEDDDENGWISIIEEPEIDKDKKPFNNLYKAGCLLPGEKIITNDGLKNVEDVDNTNKLINSEGDYVKIEKFFRRKKENADVYTIKCGNTFRTNTVTEEHPVLVTDPKFNPDLTVNENSFEFSYKEAKDIKVGDWTRVPNLYLYKKSNDLSIYTLWNDSDCRIDRRIENPLSNNDFWWFVGLWLGDGYCQSDNKKITISINSKETFYINKLEKIVNEIFDRKLERRERKANCIECSFSLIQLNLFLTKHFGKHSYGKKIPEWVKYINDDFKKKLLLGYLDSDGCISKHTKGYYNTQFISINLELLESIQDIGFSLGIVSALNKLRNASVHIFSKNRKYNTAECYQLRLGHHDTLSLAKQLDCKEDIKIQRIDFDNLPKIRKRPKDSCFISSDKRYIYFKIKDIQKEKYTGMVYNFECDTHTYIGHHIGYHNCDSYDQDEAQTSSSKGAFYVRKMFNENSKSPHYLTYVAQIIERPSVDEGGAETFFYHTALACIYYGCKNNIEYSNLRIFDYYTSHNFEVLLEERPRLAFAGMVQNTRVSNRYGTDKSLKPHILAILKDRLTQDFIDRMFFIEQINALSKFKLGKDYNCDITVATAEAEVGAKEIEHVVVKSREEDKKLIRGYIGYKLKDGMLVQTMN